MTGPDRLRLRDALVAALRVREGQKLDENLIQDRANNGVMYLELVVDEMIAAAVKAALIDARRGEVITGTIGGVDVAVGTVRAPKDERGPCGHYGCTGEGCDNEPPF